MATINSERKNGKAWKSAAKKARHAKQIEREQVNAGRKSFLGSNRKPWDRAKGWREFHRAEQRAIAARNG